MKKVAFWVVLVSGLLSSTAQAENKWYFGLGSGKAQLSYDLQQKLDKSINKSVDRYVGEVNGLVSSNLPRLNAELDKYGLPPVPADAVPALTANDLNLPHVALAESFSQSMYSFHLGYKFSRRFSVELGHQYYETFAAQASLPVNFNINEAINYEGHNGVITANGSAHGHVTAEAKMATTSLTLIFRAIDDERYNVYLKGGAAFGRADLTLTEKYTYSYNYNACVDEVCYNGTDSGSSGKTETKSYRGVVPLYGIGGEYNFDKNWTLRVEYTRLGVSSANIDSLSAGVLFRF